MKKVHNTTLFILSVCVCVCVYMHMYGSHRKPWVPFLTSLGFRERSHFKK